jgi:hypothetical protein
LDFLLESRFLSQGGADSSDEMGQIRLPKCAESEVLPQSRLRKNDLSADHVTI